MIIKRGRIRKTNCKLWGVMKMNCWSFLTRANWSNISVLFILFTWSMNTSNSSIAVKGVSIEAHNAISNDTVAYDLSPPDNELTVWETGCELVVRRLSSCTVISRAAVTWSNLIWPACPLFDKNTENNRLICDACFLNCFFQSSTRISICSFTFYFIIIITTIIITIIIITIIINIKQLSSFIPQC